MAHLHPCREANLLLGHHAATRGAGRLLLGITAAVMLLFILVFSLHYVTPLDEAKEFVNIGGEANLPTWWNASLLFLVTTLAATAAFMAEGRRIRVSWSVIAAAAAFLSLDEAVALHERLARPLADARIWAVTYPWLVLGVVVALVGSAVLILAGRSLPRATANRLAIALGCYALGALGLEAFTGWIKNHGPEILFSIGMFAEEGLEMLACIIAALAVLDYLLNEYERPHTASTWLAPERRS